jgi:triosephosphate isomerase (TIM)
MRKKIVAGNWKMNKTRQEAQTLIAEIAAMVDQQVSHQHIIIIAPPFPFLSLATAQNSSGRISVAAQNCSSFGEGAYTGEVSAAMIRSAGASYIIIGHSERRMHFKETDQQIADKVKRCLDADCTPIFCCGETQEQRNAGKHFSTVSEQIVSGLFHLDEKNLQRCIIAYEPVWAIGTGITATPEQAQEMHQYIRSLLKEKNAQDCTILYGGSCNEQNASTLFAMEDIDGGLIGGASLKSASFIEIIKALR